MPTLKPVNPSDYQDKHWMQPVGYNFASTDAAVVLVGEEVLQAASAFPIGFSYDNERVSLVGLLSTKAGFNAFVEPSGEWTGSNIPSAFRGYPFNLAKVKGEDKHILLVDEEVGITPASAGLEHPFFNQEGKLAEQAGKVVEFLTKRLQSLIRTQNALKILADLNLLDRWALLQGVYKVSEERLNALSNEDFIKVRESGSLPLIYGHFYSFTQIDHLKKLSDGIDTKHEDVDIESLFGEQDDTLKFNF